MKGGGELNTKIAYHCHWWNIIFNTAAFVWHYHYHMFICPMDSDSGGEKRLISVRARGGEINECRDVICNICMVGSSYWGCDYEKTTTRNMDIISGLGCSRMYLTYGVRPGALDLARTQPT